LSNETRFQVVEIIGKLATSESFDYGVVNKHRQMQL